MEWPPTQQGVEALAPRAMQRESSGAWLDETGRAVTKQQLYAMLLQDVEQYTRTTRRLHQTHISFPQNQPLDRDCSAAEYDQQREQLDPQELIAFWPFLDLNGSQIVLALGCGLAVREGFIAKRARLVVGLDLNPVSVRTALFKAGELNLAMAFAVGDVVHLPFADVVVDSAVSEHVYDVLTWMREILRVLKPGGVWLSITANYCAVLSPTPTGWAGRIFVAPIASHACHSKALLAWREWSLHSADTGCRDHIRIISRFCPRSGAACRPG